MSIYYHVQRHLSTTILIIITIIIKLFIRITLFDITPVQKQRNAPAKKTWRGMIFIVFTSYFRLAEVSSKEAFECLTVSSFVASHLMNCVMDCIKI